MVEQNSTIAEVCASQRSASALTMSIWFILVLTTGCFACAELTKTNWINYLIKTKSLTNEVICRPSIISIHSLIQHLYPATSLRRNCAHRFFFLKNVASYIYNTQLLYWSMTHCMTSSSTHPSRLCALSKMKKQLRAGRELRVLPTNSQLHKAPSFTQRHLSWVEHHSDRTE